MSSHLTIGQRALLRTELELRQSQLDRRVAEHHDGLSRAEHAREMLEQGADDASQRESERGLDMALSDMELLELGEVSDALRRLDEDRYGLCSDCGGEVPYDRLKAEPWAQRCVRCESKREVAARRLA